MIVKPRLPAGFFIGAIWSQMLDDETSQVAVIFYAAKKHTIAATLCREETCRDQQ
ncbi:hypothetical protein [Pseudoalteromonas sp. A757]|uniref:hypothetical protein n=1 Tax=Pseudoalteromonas sp. A757 TaxID=2250709 RepID=UPI00137558FA|nr:hypothetical protein [Pseudoalteromonas sp. A757]